MKETKIGGQAVMEGIMMKNEDVYAVAVRKQDQEIVVDVSKCPGSDKNRSMKKLPFLRGVFQFVESLTLGLRALSYSASFFEEEEAQGKSGDFSMGLTVAASIALAIAIFIALPYGLSLLFQKVIPAQWAVTLLEGLFRLLIFVGYVSAISLMPDIKRVYMYHGAEHKCINCIEHGMELNVENVRKSSRLHKRCGTSFLLVVMLISILLFLLIQVPSPVLRFLLRLVLIPVIAGISYEFIRLAGRSDNVLVNAFSAPGLLLQRLTTREPKDDMIEVGIAAVEAVFDWRGHLKERMG